QPQGPYANVVIAHCSLQSQRVFLVLQNKLRLKLVERLQGEVGRQGVFEQQPLPLSIFGQVNKTKVAPLPDRTMPDGLPLELDTLCFGVPKTHQTFKQFRAAGPDHSTYAQNLARAHLKAGFHGTMVHRELLQDQQWFRPTERPFWGVENVQRT